jgi:DNA primase
MFNNVFEVFSEHCIQSRNEIFRKYVFDKRHWSQETLDKFKIGILPSDSILGLKVRLSSFKFNSNDLIESGIVKRRGSSVLFNRLIFPITDVWGDYIAVTGRTLDENIKPKYFNTFYDKGKHLYGLFFALDEIIRTGRVYVFEGNADVLTAHQFGITNSVGCQGTTFSEDHFILLSRYAKEIILIFDNDDGGKKALGSFNKKCIEIDRAETSVYRCMFNDHKDIDEFLNSKGVDGVRKYIEQQINNNLVQGRLKNLRWVPTNAKTLSFGSRIQGATI